MEAPLVTQFRHFARDAGDVVEGALLIATLIDPDAKTVWAREELARLGAQLEAAKTPAQLVAGLRDCGFAGATETFAHQESSALDKVLERRRGLPISLAVVLIAIAERLGFSAQGINFPGHFLTRVDGTLVDPFALECTTEERCRDWLATNDIAAQDAFRVAMPVDIVLRMLNNLRMMAVAEHDYTRALEVTDYQLVMIPGAFGLHLDRAELWSALGSAEMTKHELERALDLAPDERIGSKIEDRLRALGNVDGTVN